MAYEVHCEAGKEPFDFANLSGLAICPLLPDSGLLAAPVAVLWWGEGSLEVEIA